MPTDDFGAEDEYRMRRVMDRLRHFLEEDVPIPWLPPRAEPADDGRQTAAVSGEIIVP